MNERKQLKKWIILMLIGITYYFLITNFKLVFEFLKNFIGVFMPFIIGGTISFILNIPMMKIEKILIKFIKSKSITRILSIILSLGILLLIIAFIAFLLIPELVGNIELLIESVPSLFEKAENVILNLLDKYPSIQVEIESIFENKTDMSSIISNVLNYIINGSISFISSIASGIATLFTSIIFSIYILIQKEDLSLGVKKIMYAYLKNDKAKKLITIGTHASDTFSKFITGQCLEAVILGCIFFVVLSIFKFPYALLIAVLTTITALIPIFGALIAMVIGAILIAVTSPVKAIIFILIFLIIQQIEGNFIYPKVVGASVGLTPLLTLLSISVGGSLFGILGMILALPVASILYVFIKEDVIEKLNAKKRKKQLI